MDTKRCGRCGLTKPISEFNVSRYSKTGYRSQCIECMTAERARLRDHYKAHREKPEVKAMYRSYRIEHYDARKAKARNAARKLERKPCEVCGAIKAHAHHEDYDKPLEVRWLCITHHKKRHAEMKREGIEP